MALLLRDWLTSMTTKSNVWWLALKANWEKTQRKDFKRPLKRVSSRSIPITLIGFEHLTHLSHRDVIVDALLGTGTRGEVEGFYRQAIDAMNSCGIPVVAVDIPSGIDCDTGEVLGTAVEAFRTVTFGLPKPFLFQGPGMEYCGEWSVADLGFPVDLLCEPTDAETIDSDWVASRLPRTQQDQPQRLERVPCSLLPEAGDILALQHWRRWEPFDQDAAS